MAGVLFVGDDGYQVIMGDKILEVCIGLTNANMDYIWNIVRSIKFTS